MTREQLFEQIKLKKSFLCVGLDTDVDNLPSDDILEQYAGTGILNDANRLLYFNKAIIDATHHLAVAYKPNYWFYAAYGSTGIAALEATVTYIKSTYPDLFVIIDLKGGDIMNTAAKIARTAFQTMPGDAVTINPYMGRDVAEPFLQHKDKWIIALGLTSNKSAEDFQMLTTSQGARCSSHKGLFFPNSMVYEEIIAKAATWGNDENTMFVVGATKAEMLLAIRDIIPDHFLLIPGVGAQGGSLKDVATYGMTDDCGLLVNSSRDIIYAIDRSKDYAEIPKTWFAEAAEKEATKVQQEMEQLLKARGIV